MLHLILGRTGTGKTTRLLTDIRKRADQGIAGQILLVPEQFSLSAERALCKVCGNQIALSAEVLSFRNLANRVLLECSGGAFVPLDEGGRLLSMYLAVSQVQPALRLYRDTGKRPEVLARLLSFSDECKSYGVLPADLALLGDDGSLFGEKLNDLALILGAYDALLSGDLGDPANRLSALADALADGKWLAGKHIAMDGFNGFTGEELNLIRQMARYAESVTVALCTDGVADNDAGVGVFSHVKRTIARLTETAESDNIPVEITLLPETCHRFAEGADDLAYIERALFDYTAQPKPGCDGSVICTQADTVETECALAATEIRRLLEQGYRYRDIAVVTGQLETYAPVIQRVFRRYGLPVFLDRRSDVAQRLPLRVLLSALDIVSGQAKPEQLMSLIKTGLAGVSVEDADRLDLYRRMWHPTLSVFLSEKGFTENPAGFGVPFAQDALDRLNALREQVAQPLRFFRKAVSNAPTAETIAKALYDYALQIDLPGALEARADALAAVDRVQDGDTYRQLWQLICDSLDQMILIVKNTPMTVREFTPLFRLLLTTGSVGLLPSGADVLSVGDTGRSRVDHPRALFALGATDGTFPKKEADGGLLTRQDRKWLREEANMVLAPTGEEWVAWEDLVVYQTVTAPSELLWISWPLLSASGDRVQPSYPVSRILTLLPDLPLRTDASEGVAPLTYSRSACLSLAARSCDPAYATAESLSAREALSQDPEACEFLARAKASLTPQRSLSPESAGELYGTSPTVTASRMEKHFTCPFAHFAQYGLKARPQQLARFDAANIGSYVHYVLENTARDIQNSCGFSRISEIDEAFLQDAARRHSDTFAREQLGGLENKTPRFRYLFRRLYGRIVALLKDMVAEFAASSFVPVNFELSLAQAGPGGSPLFFTTEDGQSLRLDGRIDRLDEWVFEGKRYVRIVDYKTGTKDFKYGDVEDGIGIQLLLYLFALAAGDPNMIPAGVLYKPTGFHAEHVAPGENAAEKWRSARKPSGLVREEPEILSAMENIPEGARERYLPCEYKLGKYSGTALVSKEQLDTLNRHITGLITRMGRELWQGHAACSPRNNACDFCDYRRACRFDPYHGDAAHAGTVMNAEAFYRSHQQEEDAQ